MMIFDFLIDADALEKQGWLMQRTVAVNPQTMEMQIRKPTDFPTIIDAVRVVRCKNCKHWGVHKSLNVPWCFKMHIDKSEDGYCDSGERKRDETD